MGESQAGLTFLEAKVVVGPPAQISTPQGRTQGSIAWSQARGWSGGSWG